MLSTHITCMACSGSGEEINISTSRLMRHVTFPFTSMYKKPKKIIKHNAPGDFN